MGTRVEHDEAWFVTVYNSHYTHIVHYGRRRLANLDASVELAQEVFAIAWRRRAVVPQDVLPWLYGVARRLLANQWRARKAAPAMLSLDDAGYRWELNSAAADAASEVSDVYAALAALPEVDREILRLIGWERLTVTEAAEVLGCARGTAAVRLYRARKRLSRAMSTRTVPPLAGSGSAISEGGQSCSEKSGSVPCSVLTTRSAVRV